MTPTEVEGLAGIFISAIERGDLSALERLYAPNLVVWHNFDQVEQSRAENIKALMGIVATYRNFRYERIRLHCFQGGYVQQHMTCGTAASGADFRVPVCMVVLVSDGQITRIDEYLDLSYVPRG